MTEWKNVIGWEDIYEVSEFGIIRRIEDGFIVGQWPNHNGYMLLRLSRPRIIMRVHRIVAMAFIPNPENKRSVNHIDCDPKNNNATNLEWCTQEENLKHMRSLGRGYSPKGSRGYTGILSDEEVQEMRELRKRTKLSYSKIGDKFGVKLSVAFRCIKGETYQYIEHPTHFHEIPPCPPKDSEQTPCS